MSDLVIEKLKAYLRQRHDYLETQYNLNHFSADAVELGFYRTVYQVIKDIEAQESRAKPNPLKGARTP